MHVQVMGMGCAKCAKLYEEIKSLVAEAGADVTVDKEEDIQKIMAAGVLSTPGLVIDGRVVASGSVPGRDELKNLLGL